MGTVKDTEGIMRSLVLVSALFGIALAQNAGDQNPAEVHPEIKVSTCTASGCTQESSYVVLDANWRWTHKVDDYVNCFTGNEWDAELCPDPDTCTQNCAVENLKQEEWEGTYGISVNNGDELALKFVTEGPYSKNIGSRVYLLDSDDTNYRLFKLLNQEFTFDVDVSMLDCGLNGALYFVEMDADGGLSYEGNNAGAKFGTGYCDAQCPHDIKWINGKANSGDWTPSDNDENSGKGHFGSCCYEMDIWEANKISQAYTVHSCDVDGQTQCEGTDCGDNDTGERYDGVCDKDGCDFGNFRLGDLEFFGPGKTVDSNQKMTVVTQFITDDGTDQGTLVEIRRKYVQNGQVIENNFVDLGYDSITEDFCTDSRLLFGDPNEHAEKGGMAAMGESLKKGHVLVLSLWDDHEAFMLWLDSDYPLDKDPSEPGVHRGTCPTTSGRPEDVEVEQAESTVRFSNIKIGDLDTTY